MAIKTKQMIIGIRKNLSVQKEDLDTLKRLRIEGESLSLTFHRILDMCEALINA